MKEMQMEIREISNDELLQLVALTTQMYKEIDPAINNFGAMATLVHDIQNKPDFFALGLFKGAELVGFTTGYGVSKKVFYFSGIYVIIKNNKHVKNLIDFSFAFIKDKGYSAWQADATNGNISSILEKYGAEAKYTRYYKEME